jgi:putative restriction endonuclease
MPFYHLRSEPFWQLIPNIGCEKWVESKSSMRSLGNLTIAIQFALIDEELSNLLLVSENRDIFKIAILDRYFPNTKSNYGINGNDDLPSVSILHENSEEYQRKIIELKNQVDENTFQEEIFIRGGLFKREIPKIYNNTCAISGLRLTSVVSNVSMVDACHIVPFSESCDDTLTNGIALCPNLHRAFDRGLISISDDYTVLINQNFVEDKNSAFSLSQFQNQRIILPYSEDLFPALGNLYKHRNKNGF